MLADCMHTKPPFVRSTKLRFMHFNIHQFYPKEKVHGGREEVTMNRERQC